MSTTTQQLTEIRDLMRTQGLTAYIIPNTDPHQGEYIAPHWQIINWLSGFTGSAGTIVITDDFAGVWTDSRYFIQAESQLANSDFDLMRLRVPHSPEYIGWICDNLPEGSTVGVDARLFSMTQVAAMQQRFENRGIGLESGHDLVAPTWTDRPDLPTASIFVHQVAYAGKSRIEKLATIREGMNKRGATLHLVNALDEIAWILNLRGSDISYNPVIICYALIGLDTATLFIDPAKVSEGLRGRLESDGIVLAAYESIQESLTQLPPQTSLLLAPAQTSEWLGTAIPAEVKLVSADNPATQLKAVKNEVEQAHIREVMVKDGVAMVHFLKWLEENVGKAQITEVSAAAQLLAFRAEQADFVGESFGTIAGYGPHGAIVHYSATADTDMPLQSTGLFLLDSGGQYLDGTTDITRTIALGTPTEQEMQDYTLVLRGHIGLAKAIFPQGTQGHQLDVLARQPLWQQGINYGHGTGHGVGFFLNVHEGPQRIGTGKTGAEGSAFVPGMLTSNEPGLYRAGKHGIRIENLVLTVPKAETEFGTFYAFETVTLCPIDTRPIKRSWLSKEEIEWLNTYHKRVWEALSPHLSSDAQHWLKEKCRSI